MKNVLLLGFLVFALAGCEARLDGSSSESLSASIKEMKDQLPPNQAATINQDIFNSAGLMPVEQALDILDGLTYDELHYLGQTTRLSGYISELKRGESLVSERILEAQKEIDKLKLLGEQVVSKVKVTPSIELGTSEIDGKQIFTSFSVQITNNSAATLSNLNVSSEDEYGVMNKGEHHLSYDLELDTPIKPGETRTIVLTDLAGYDVREGFNPNAAFMVFVLNTENGEEFSLERIRSKQGELANEAFNLKNAKSEREKLELQLAKIK